MSNYYLGNYRCIRNTGSKDHQLIVLEGRNADEINSYLVSERLQANIIMQHCEIIPIYDNNGSPFAFHMKDCTIEIFDGKNQDRTYILITNKDSKKRKVALGELEKSLEHIPKRLEVAQT